MPPPDPKKKQRMAAQISASSHSAKTLSSKVRDMDTAQTFLNQAIYFVENVVNLKQTVGIVEAALKDNDLVRTRKKNICVGGVMFLKVHDETFCLSFQRCASLPCLLLPGAILLFFTFLSRPFFPFLQS